jgi:hypothetical protein
VTDASEGAGDTRFDRAIAQIDAANAEDPVTLVVDGVARPKEQAHAELMTETVCLLDPQADEVQLLAARAHHLRRWTVPRADFPEGRAGYLRWRTGLKKQHAADVGAILETCGYEPAEIDRVQRIVRKEGLGTDPAVQVHEDALCLVFLRTQLADLADQLGHDHIVTVIAKTMKKMSPAAIDRVATLGLPDAHLALVTEAAASA